jgi:hypothetical protein
LHFFIHALRQAVHFGARKTALGLPSALVAKARRGMRRHCLAIEKAKGGLIKE